MCLAGGSTLSYVSGSLDGGTLARGCWLRCRDGDSRYFGFPAFFQTHELFTNTCPFSSARVERQYTRRCINIWEYQCFICDLSPRVSLWLKTHTAVFFFNIH